MPNSFSIRPMIETDIDVIDAVFQSQGWDSRKEILTRYYTEQLSGARKVYVAVLWDTPVGYATLLPEASAGPFVGTGIPEVSDFNVFIAYRRRGYGNAILDASEADVAKTHDRISLGVGLYTDYGTAQRMYVKRGYIPDGSGVWWNDKPLPPYEPCVNDDGLVLYLSKELK